MTTFLRTARRRIGLALGLVLITATGLLLLPPQGEDQPKLKAVRAFPELRLRYPTLITNAGDHTNRMFVAQGAGAILLFANEQNVTETEMFLDLEQQVVCEGEQGLLGLAFHPDYRHNGEFFVYYSTTEAENTSVISRFHVSKKDPNKADPLSEKVLLRIQHSGLHIGGTLAFGPDGLLYIGLGDGAGPGDKYGNGQDLSTLLGSVLRIDVDRQDAGKPYAIPADNPFVDRVDARPEIWAYGLRNVWRMAFDRQTGILWAGNVGEDTWEEINIIQRGGNYGWSLREGKHPFGPQGSGPREGLIEPIWEFNHDVGRSVTGGVVYRGQKIPKLQGAYLFADYVTNNAWVMRYDHSSKKVKSVSPIEGIENMPIVAFGEDEEGEVYFLDLFGRIYELAELAK